MHLTAENLTCVRGGRIVFEGLDLAVKGGEALALTGPNGAGKTSLLRILSGLLPPETGRVRLDGTEEDATPGEQCHFVGHLNGVKRALTVAENLAFQADYLGGGGVDDALGTFGLGALRDIPAGLLSAGQARRLALARLAVAHRPVWLLDEPASALDEDARKILERVIAGHLEAGGIAVAATHGGLGVTFAQTLDLGDLSGGGKRGRR